MKKFDIYEDEYYPFYKLEKTENDENIKLSDSDYKFIKKAYEDFYNAQDIIKTKLEFEIEKEKKSSINKQDKCKHDYILACSTTLRRSDKIIKYSDYKCHKCGKEKMEYE